MIDKPLKRAKKKRKKRGANEKKKIKEVEFRLPIFQLE
jgi:hypothetical protein